MKQLTQLDEESTRTQQEDAALLKAIARGDRFSFDRLHSKFAGIVHNTIYKVLNDRQDTEDVAQEVFNQVWLKAKMFDSSRGKPLTWVATLARNRAIDRLRSKQRRAKLRDALDNEHQTAESATGKDSSDLAVAAERGMLVRSAVMELSNDQQEAIRLAYFEGMTQAEIADKLGQPLGTVKARIRRGVQRLRGTIPARLDS